MPQLVVLIVEDDAILRLDAADMVTEAGHVAIEASNADDAIALLETRPDITTVFTDIEMPGTMDGILLAHAVRNRWPPVTVVVASGRIKPGRGELPENVAFLAKPYSPQAVHLSLGLS